MAMKIYRVKITGDRFPTDYNVQASCWATGIARAVREWQKRFKGNRTEFLNIRAIKSTPLLDAKNGEI